jgi:hypothetical protein
MLRLSLKVFQKALILYLFKYNIHYASIQEVKKEIVKDFFAADLKTIYKKIDISAKI